MKNQNITARLISEFQKSNFKLEKSTLKLYLEKLHSFFKRYDEMNMENLHVFVENLNHSHKPATINNYIAAINSFLKFLNKKELILGSVKIQNENFSENIISDAEYSFLKNKFVENNKTRDYYIIKVLAGTGVRASEIVNLKIEDIKLGIYNCFGKNKKYRKIPIPKQLQTELLNWVECAGRNSGYLFLNEYRNKNNKMKARNIYFAVRNKANSYGMNTQSVYPHSFRHYFAKKFLKSGGAITTLSDLLGHDSINTTMKYLKLSSKELCSTVNKIVNWI